MSIEIKLSRSNRIYRPNETLEGNIITRLPSPISHQGIRLTVTGSVQLQVRGGSAGVIESFYGVVKPIPIMKKSVQVSSSGKIGSGTTEIPFSVILKHPGEVLEKFYETFHGANISIQYLVKVEVVRGYLQKSLSATVEFINESETVNLPEKPVSPEMVIFYITQDTQRHSLLPELKSGGFRVTGKICTQCSLLDPISGELTVEASAVPIYSIDIPSVPKWVTGKICTQCSLLDPISGELTVEASAVPIYSIDIPSVPKWVTGKICTQCSLLDPISGELTVEASAVPIYSIDIHLLRVESIMVGDKIVTETSLIQTTQVANGDVCRNMSLPIYVILPRLLTCPTLFAGPFSIEFKVTVVITFQSELQKLHPKVDPKIPRLWLAMESVPLELLRTK